MVDPDDRNPAILRSVRCSLRLIAVICSQLRDGLPVLAGDRPTEAQRQAILSLDAALAQASKTAGAANLALSTIPVEPAIKHYVVVDSPFSEELDRQWAALTQPRSRRRRHTGKFLIAYKTRLRK